MLSLHQRARLDADRIEPPPAPLPDPDVVYDHIMGLVSLARALDPGLPHDVRFVRHAPLDEEERNTASFRVMFTNDTKPLSEGGYRDANARELWEVLGELLPAEMIADEQANLRSSPRFRFASAEDAAVMSAFRGMRLELETKAIDDDKVIQVSRAVRPADMAFMSTPTLARWVFLAPLREAPGVETPLAPRQWREDVQFVRQVLSHEFEDSSVTDRARLKEVIGRMAGRRTGNFEEDHNHGLVGYALAHGTSSWTPFLLAAGASPYATYNGVTPIAWAIAADAPGAVRELCAKGVTPSAILTAAPPVYQGGEQDELAGRTRGFAPLIVYAAAASASRAMSALLDAGADPDVQNDLGSTAMHLSASVADERSVRVLLGRHARLDIENRAGALASQLVPEGSDSLFEMLESIRLGEAPAPVAVATPAADADEYGEPASLWVEKKPARARPRAR